MLTKRSPSIVRCALGSSVPDPHSLSRSQLPILKYIALRCLGKQTLNAEDFLIGFFGVTAQERTGSVATKPAGFEEAPIELNDLDNFDDPQSSAVSRDQVWTDETDQVIADADMEDMEDADMDDVSSMQQIETNEDPKGKKKLAINYPARQTRMKQRRISPAGKLTRALNHKVSRTANDGT